MDTETQIRRHGEVAWAVDMRCYPGERVCGDMHCVTSTERGVLLVVADGLGHGPEANRASSHAISTATDVATVSRDLITIAKECHSALQRTRGAAVSFAEIVPEDNCLHWLAVGNVDGCLAYANETERPYCGMLLRGGVVGRRLPPLRVNTQTMSPGDVLVIVTDGIASGFQRSVRHDVSVQENARNILAQHDKDSDDAMVLVARYGGVADE